MLTIAFFGPVNSGKSTLVNAIAGQEVSLVSPVPGTTTDPVRKRIELPGLGPCVLIDTAGLGDGTALGTDRERRTRAILDETDVAVVVLPSPSEEEVSLMLPNLATLGSKKAENVPNAPFFGALSTLGIPTVTYSRGESVEELLQRIAAAVPKEEERHLTGSLVKVGDCVLLVMPQDSEAPKGRIILPQVQVLRELLDRGCNALCCTPESLSAALERVRPDLVITDSQVFARVHAALPAEVPLTSFSVLLAGAKGDLPTFVEGAKAIDTLRPGDRVLIAEACTHVPDTEDIGRVKIPALLRKKMADQVGHDGVVAVAEGGVGCKPVNCNPTTSWSGSDLLYIDIAAGNDFPEDLSPYALIIHCGACVATATLVRSRIRKARLAGVPITNYGIALAKLQGILDRIVLP